MYVRKGSDGLGGGAAREAGRRWDFLDGISLAFVAAATVFLVSFFWQAAAASRGGEVQYLARLRQAAEKRIEKERAKIGSVFELDSAGRGDEAWRRALEMVEGEGKNSQLHLYLVEGHRARRNVAQALFHARAALELNREYTDRRSPFYRGRDLEDLVREARALYLAGSPLSEEGGGRSALRDLYFIERSLAGGCH